MSTSPDDINALLAGARLNRTPQANLPNPSLLPPGAVPSLANATNATGFDQGTIQAMLALHGQQNQQANIARQRKLADQLRADAGGLMGTKQVGRVAVGPRWYDALANVAANAEATREDLASNEASKKIDTDYTDTINNIITKYGKARASI